MCCCECKCQKQPERVLTAEQTVNHEGLVRALEKAERSGQLDALKRRFWK